ncbi:MAG: hypothetical protein N2749_05775 [Clostridia bacterium]|nr:hypothetical protein [Clostridia bacterium]
MADSKLIIVEGPQGTGKTTTTDFIRYYLPYTNLYRLYGTKDSSPTGLLKAEKMYQELLNYIETLQNCSINLLFDRTFFTEENYCRLGFKDYSFTEVYNTLVERLNNLDFDIYYITLYLEDTSLFEERLKRENKATVKYANFNIDSSIKQQETYLQMADEIEKKYKNIKVFRVSNDGTPEELKSKIIEIIGEKKG